MFSDHLAAQAAANLRRWHESGLPLRWIEARQGHWDHAAWEQLLAELRASPYWPLDPAAIGQALEEQRRHWYNLRRWQDSGWPRHWVETHGGAWNHGDWMALLEQLRSSEFWPLESAEVGRVLEELAMEWRNLRRWQESGDARQWVEDHEGQWGHTEWQQLVETLRQSGFWPMNLGAAGRLLEELKLAYWNLRRWRDSGLARRWVEANDGRWDHATRLTLLDALQKSDYWPLDTVALWKVLEQLRQQQQNLRRWEESGAAQRWLDSRRGPWGEADWQALLGQLRTSEFWPLEPQAVRRLLQERGMGRNSPDHWRVTGLARLWVEAHQGEWSRDDWQALLAELERHHFGPVDPLLLSRVVEEVRADWWQIRPWLRRGQAKRVGSREDLRGLLEALRRSEFWPAAERPASARQAA
jgi:hypothetical protein